MENNFMQIIKTRRSCRHYRDEQVDDQLLHTVMEAGTYAPTGHGTQDPQIVAVQNPALKQRLAALNAQIMGVDSNPYYDAPYLSARVCIQRQSQRLSRRIVRAPEYDARSTRCGTGHLLDQPRISDVPDRRGPQTDGGDGHRSRPYRHRSTLAGLPLARTERSQTTQGRLDEGDKITPWGLIKPKLMVGLRSLQE